MAERLHWKGVCRAYKAGSAVCHHHCFYKMPNLNQKPKAWKEAERTRQPLPVPN